MRWEIYLKNNENLLNYGIIHKKLFTVLNGH